MKPFWLCWVPQGTSTPKHKHATLEEAKAEAQRLVEQHGGSAYVLKAVGVAQRVTQPVAYEDIPAPPTPQDFTVNSRNVTIASIGPLKVPEQPLKPRPPRRKP